MESVSNIPLPQRMRPKSLEDYLGQGAVVAIFRRFIEQGALPSFILWGPPGVGKTTLAGIIAESMGRQFFSLSAINAGVKDVREIIEKAKNAGFFNTQPPILFIDEIHRFTKAQQDSLLGAVEQGVVTLIGATTENPSFEVIKPLLSRCNVYVLKSLSDDDLTTLLHRTIKTDSYLKHRKITIEGTSVLFNFAAGDARRLLNILDTIVSATEGEIIINDDNIIAALQQNAVRYDKNGEEHYDVISAFIKSVRGSDPNAAIYYLARMISAGEEARFIARRLVILASEDIGLANPNALLLANTCFDTVNNIGMPEARIPLAQTTIYLATSPKSNSAYMAINNALDFIKNDRYRPVPLNIRNSVTDLMQREGYGAGYKYSHDFPEHFVAQEFMPEGLSGTQFWSPADNPAETQHQERMKRLWNK